MRATFSIFLSALLFCGCSQKHTVNLNAPVDIIAGKDIVVRSYTLNIKKRVGSSLEGIRILRHDLDGGETIVTADTGMLAQQRVEVPQADSKVQERLRLTVIHNSVMITLRNATIISEKGGRRLSVTTMEKLEMFF